VRNVSGNGSIKLLMFTYGTLVNDSMRFNVLGRDTAKYPASLFNYEVVTHSHAHYPTIKPKLGSITQGVLFNVDGYDLNKLDRYENNLYDRIYVMINNTRCFAYIERVIVNMTKRGQLIQEHLNDPNNIFEFESKEDELGYDY